MEDKEKAEEVERIKEQNGYTTAEEPKTVDDEELGNGDVNEE